MKAILQDDKVIQNSKVHINVRRCAKKIEKGRPLDSVKLWTKIKQARLCKLFVGQKGKSVLAGSPAE